MGSHVVWIPLSMGSIGHDIFEWWIAVLSYQVTFPLLAEKPGSYFFVFHVRFPLLSLIDALYLLHSYSQCWMMLLIWCWFVDCDDRRRRLFKVLTTESILNCVASRLTACLNKLENTIIGSAYGQLVLVPCQATLD